jgi:hypothetical protein
MFSLSFTRVVHETLAVETETETFLIRDETEMRRREVYTKPVLGAGELMGLRPGPLAPPPERPRARGGHAPVCSGPHTILSGRAAS